MSPTNSNQNTRERKSLLYNCVQMLNNRYVSIAKYTIKKFIPEKIWSISSRIYEAKQSQEFNQRLVKPKNSIFDESVFVIRRRPPGGGLFSNVNHVLQGLDFAQNNGLLPVVDMENYWTSYCQKQQFTGSHNSWEYFFNPVSTVKLSDINLYQEIIFSSGDRINPHSILADKGLKFVLNERLIDELHKLFMDFIELNNTCKDLLLKVKDFLDWESITAGASYRGTDYVALQPKGHARQPSLKDFMTEVEAKLRIGREYRLLISTEDMKVKTALLSSYSDISYKDFRNHETLKKMLPTREHVTPKLLDALGYLVETYLLSEAETIVSTIANGSATAIILNGNKYSKPVIIDKGVY